MSMSAEITISIWLFMDYALVAFLDAAASNLDIRQIEQPANMLIDELHNNQAPMLDTPHSTHMAAIGDAVDLMRLRGLIAHTDGRFMAVVQEKLLLHDYANAIAHWLSDRKWT